MLLPVPLGYFVSTFLIICGTLNCLDYLAHKPENCTRAVLLNGLAEAGWPIIAASIILLLIQVNKQLEKLRLERTASIATELPKARIPVKKKSTAHEPVHPAPSVNLATLVQAPAPAPEQQQAASGTSTSPHKPLYPNSPIPGGGRVPQHPAPSASLPPRPDFSNNTQSAKRAPSKSEAGSLSFFKVD